MKVMIFAAGLGTRLKPLTDQMPKALVSVGGKPLLQILMEKLLAAGAEEVVINIHHFASQIREYVEAHRQFGIDVKFSDESDKLLETGGGVKKARLLLAGDAPFLIHNVDILSNVDLKDFYQKHCQYAATLLVSERKTSRYLLFDDDMRLVGWTNIDTGQVKSPYPNLEVHSCRKYAFSGIHLFSPSLFPYFDEWPDKFSIVDFYLSVCAQEKIMGCVKTDLKLMDVGKIDTLAKAEEFLQVNQEYI